MQRVSSLLEIVGIIVVLAAGFLFDVRAGAALVGAGLIIVGYALGGDSE